jgi:HD-GYP domain-containing protein (c-di-GMP phosphodiesterase class II)
MERGAELSVAISKELGLSKQVLRGIHLGATILDIVKIYIPGEIVN